MGSARLYHVRRSNATGQVASLSTWPSGQVQYWSSDQLTSVVLACYNACVARQTGDRKARGQVNTLTLDTLKTQADMLARMADKALEDAIAAYTWNDEDKARECLSIRRRTRQALAETRQKISLVEERR